MSDESAGERGVREEQGHYLCESCIVLYGEPGMCPKCEEEPLVDVRDEEAMRWIRERDERRFFRRTAKFAVVGMVLMTPLNIALAMWTFPTCFGFLFEHRISLNVPIILICGSHIFLLAWSVLFVESRLMQRFPIRRAASLVDGEEERARTNWRERFALLWSLFMGWRTNG